MEEACVRSDCLDYIQTIQGNIKSTVDTSL